ncbi:MAG: DNA-3-methyladenine glycosylase 2 family protein [Saprospiraceae bacterium]
MKIKDNVFYYFVKILKTMHMDKRIIQHLQQDKILYQAIQKVDLVVEKPKISLFEHLLKSIVSQQLSLQAAATIHTRFRNSIKTLDVLPQHIFDKNHDELRAFGLSNQKARYLQNIAEYFEENNLMNYDWSQLSDEEIVEKLIPIKGVGIWTIQMILIFHLGREDVFPTDDLAIKNRICKWYEIEGNGKEVLLRMNEIASTWQPYRSIACRYIWAAGDL